MERRRLLYYLKLAALLFTAASTLAIFLLLKKIDGDRMHRTHRHMRLFANTFADRIGDNITKMADGLIPIDLSEQSDSVDQWGTPYRVEARKNGTQLSIRVRSAGPDRSFDTSDDLEWNSQRDRSSARK